jgi:hydroxymethylpyrimidine/phosphomethylpyrimidine kinase
MKRILTIAGSDSGGGAGIQADLKAVTVLGGYGLSVITALTAQNTLGVNGVWPVPVEFIALQMDTVLSDIGADAVKTGMLATAEVVHTVAEGLKRHHVPNLVVDPVMVAASGASLLRQEAVDTLKKELLPLADLVTPNLYEAAILSGLAVTNLEQMEAAAKSIHSLGAKLVLVKGGHLAGRAVDLLYDGRTTEAFEVARIRTENTHGTGCTLSAALAFFLANGHTPAQAVALAKDFITEAIRASIKIGAGCGPTNPYARILMIEAREQVLEDLRLALARLLAEPAGRIIPEIRSNLGYALPGASRVDQVAAVPGRISQIEERLVAYSEPAFGASRHVAKVILAAMGHDPETRSAMAIRYSPEILEACRELGYGLAVFNRAEEPREVKEREGSSLEWGTSRALEGLTETPVLVFDLGEVGKEPIIRILGRNPGQVVDRVLAVYRRLAGN